MADLGAGDERFRDDHGAVDPAVEAALTAYAAGTGAERPVLTALTDSRLLVPVVAVLDDQPATPEPARPEPATPEPDAGGGPPASVLPGGEKASEMAMPVIVGRDGRRALPAFTCAGAMRLWRQDSRPVPVPALAVWQSAVQEACAVIIDIAGPVPLAVEGSRLAALAAGAPVPALHEDPDVWQLVAATAAECAPGIRVRLSQPPDGLDLAIELAPPEGEARPVPAAAAGQVGDAVTARLAGRARRGIAVLVRPPG
jgi:SseB protein N-terminal domain